MSWQAASVNNNAVLKGNDTAMQSNERKQFLSLFSHLPIDWIQNHQLKNTGSGLSPKGATHVPVMWWFCSAGWQKMSKQTHGVKFCSGYEDRAEQRKQTWTYTVTKLWVRSKEMEEGKRVLFGSIQLRYACCFSRVISISTSISIDSVSRVQLHFAILPLRISTGSENICASHELPPEKIRMDKLHLLSGRKWNPDKSLD